MSHDKPAGLSSDPYRREPPTIELKPGEFQTSTAEPASGADSSAAVAGATAEAGETAIESMAATGLDGKLPEETVAPADQGSAEKGDPPAPHAEAAGETGPRSTQEAGAPSEAPLRGAPQDEGLRSQNRGAGFGGLLAASVIGGLVGAGLAVGADRYLEGTAEPPPNYESRITALEKRPIVPAGPTNAGPAASNPELERRIAALEAQGRTLSEAVNAARSAAEASAKSAAEAASRPAPAAAEGATPSAAPPGPDPAVTEALGRLENRLGQLEPRLAAVETRANGAAPAGALDDIRNRLVALTTATEERGRSAAGAVEALGASLAGLDKRVGAQSEQVSALSAELAKLPPSTLQTALRAVVAGQVADALRTGAPLGPALAATERLGVERAQVEPLLPYANDAAPSAAALAAEFKPLAEKLLAEPQTPAGSFGDRLLRIAEKVVTVRSVGDGSGEDIPGLVGRIEAALARGALADAAAAWNRLPEVSRQASAEWGAKLKRRVAAEAAARKLGSDSLAALGAPSR